MSWPRTFADIIDTPGCKKISDRRQGPESVWSRYSNDRAILPGDKRDNEGLWSYRLCHQRVAGLGL
jgi:hypothetical protein